MSLVSVQCPNCGSPVEAGAPGTLMRCPSCASVLEIKTGSSGYPLAMLTGIGRDTGFLARQQAVTRLKDQLQRLGEQRSRLEEEVLRVERDYAPPKVVWRGIVSLAILGVFAASGGNEGIIVALLVWGTAGMMAYRGHARINASHRAQETRVTEARARLDPQIAALDAEITTSSAALARVEADLDRMAREF